MPLLLSETYAQGRRRLADDLRVATQILRDSASEPGGGWARAQMIVEQGMNREARALASVRVFAGENREAAHMVDAMSTAGSVDGGTSVQLNTFYMLLHHGAASPSPRPTDAEVAASRKVPVNVSPLDTYLTNRGKVGAAAGGQLHGLMRTEVYNFVDGRRSYYDIYKAVYAESMAAGNWYYGTVTLEDVARLLDAAVAAGALKLK